MNEILRKIPSVDEILKSRPVQPLIGEHSRTLVAAEIQACLAEIRKTVAASDEARSELERWLARLPELLGDRLAARTRLSLQKVINATGVILHTNIGRAPLPGALLDSIRQTATSYSNLEFDTTTANRGHRDAHIQSRLRQLLGCEASTVVNNNAAALFLILKTLASGKKVLVSRGELVEIGGSFRIPEILESSGAILREVGTTNKTRLADYRNAIDDEVGLILRVHPSNYRVTGFTERPELSELVTLSRETAIPLVKDAGSGYLFRSEIPCLANEPVVSEALQAGVDLVCFSGDKLLGGPQAGLILGRKSLVDRVRRHPLMRICRVDKITYAALDWVLVQYVKGRHLETLPIYRCLSASKEELRSRCQALAGQLAASGFECSHKDGVSVVGGGAAPGETIPTALLLVRSPKLSPNAMEAHLRLFDPPIVARIEDDFLVLDLRTVSPEDDAVLAGAFSSLASG